MDDAILEEVRTAVADCIRQHSMLDVGPLAHRIAAHHENASEEEIAELALLVGGRAGVPIRISRL